MDNPFWTYSIAVYGRPGVAPLCLEAQDREGLDVNLLLYAGWLATRGERLETAHLQAAIEAGAQWRQRVVVPLRALRRDWRDLAGAQALRAGLQTLELDAERIQQDLLWQCHQDGSPLPAGGDLQGNLACVWHAAGAGDAHLLDRLATALAPAAGVAEPG